MIQRVVRDTLLQLRVWNSINLQISCKNSGSKLKNWAGFRDLKNFRIWDFAWLDERRSTKLAQFFIYRAHVFEMAFMAGLQGAIFPSFLRNLSVRVGNLSPANINWKLNILSQGKNSPAFFPFFYFFHHTLTKISTICIRFWFLILV